MARSLTLLTFELLDTGMRCVTEERKRRECSETEARREWSTTDGDRTRVGYSLSCQRTSSLKPYGAPIMGIM